MLRFSLAAFKGVPCLPLVGGGDLLTGGIFCLCAGLYTGVGVVDFLLTQRVDLLRVGEAESPTLVKLRLVFLFPRLGRAPDDPEGISSTADGVDDGRSSPRSTGL